MLAFTVNKTYEIWDQKSIEIGDTDDKGFEYEDHDMDLRYLISELRNCTDLSDTVITEHTWATSHGSIDMYDGSHTNESIHIKSINGHKPTAHQLKRLFKAAGLTK